jgi:hypothetical protein
VWRTQLGCGVAQLGCGVDQLGCGVAQLGCGVAQLGCGLITVFYCVQFCYVSHTFHHPFHTYFFQASDPIQALFAEKIREYDTKKKAAGKVVVFIVYFPVHFLHIYKEKRIAFNSDLL